MKKYCQYCEKLIYGENKEFCNRECYLASGRVVLVCQYCNNPFTVPKSKSHRMYCCVDCRGKGQKDSTKKIIKNCEMCGKEFESWAYRNRRFCSRLCGNKNAARHPKPKLRKPEIHIVKQCVICGNDYKTTTHQERLRGSSCCSVECVAELNSRRMKGKNNPNWKGGWAVPDHLIDYGDNWERQRRKVQKRDSHKCQICGYVAWKGTTILDVHHIVPFRLFNGNWKEANSLSNLVLLCRPCHSKVEQGKLKCPAP